MSTVNPEESPLTTESLLGEIERAPIHIQQLLKLFEGTMGMNIKTRLFIQEIGLMMAEITPDVHEREELRTLAEQAGQIDPGEASEATTEQTIADMYRIIESTHSSITTLETIGKLKEHPKIVRVLDGMDEETKNSVIEEILKNIVHTVLNTIMEKKTPAETTAIEKEGGLEVQVWEVIRTKYL